MGLKRRAVGRKQVLDLTEKQDSPRRSWQTKYQQICVEHENGEDTPPVGGASSSATPPNPLSGLLASYHSDSDDEEGRQRQQREGDLDSKVSDFLQEIQTMVPSGSSLVVPGQPITTPGIVGEGPRPVSAWQECYDETTGYIYYWHTETNAVTWETPLEHLPKSVGGDQAADVASLPLHHHHGATPPRPQWPHHPPQPVQARPLVEYNAKPDDRGSSESEEERIEMITSFGESSEEESEEEARPPSKRRKGPIGPRPRSPAPPPDGSGLLSDRVDDVGPPGVEAEPPPPPPDEGAILSQLRSRARELRELGGELPEEIRGLIEPQPQPQPEEEGEGPPDFELEMELMERELRELAQAAQAAQTAQAAPTSPRTGSFALIAGYGDDSDQEEGEGEEGDRVPPAFEKRTFESLPTAPVKNLFPIAEPDREETQESLPESPQEVPSSILFPSASVPAPPALRLQESNGVERAISPPPIEPIVDSALPKKAGRRKKRLEITTSTELVAASKAAAPLDAGVECGEGEGERKGLETDADTFLLDCINEFESKKVVATPRDEDDLNGAQQQPVEEVKEQVTESPVVQQDEKVSEADSRLEEEACRQVGDLAQTIMEKAAFLAEGKEPASPVQVLAIQIETLVSAWHADALSRSYLSKWLGETGDELGQLETSAAPDGWACQWDRPDAELARDRGGATRSHKRYYYCNLSSGETQWEYPEEEMEADELEAEVTPQVEELPPSPQARTIEDIVGGELAMEICNTPPHSPSPPPPARLQTPPPPPPPTISESRELSPPPPPRISPFPPVKGSEERRQQKGRHKRRRAVPPPTVASKDPSGSNKTKRGSPTPPPPDLNPPLPPLPPPPSSPPPPPPADIPPLPPASPRQQLAYGEPLPPGVDPGEIPYMARPAPPLAYQNPEQPTAGDLESYHAMQASYVLASYQSAMVQPGSIQQGAPVMDYSGVPYLMHTHMSMPAVIAKPPAKKHKAALHAALDSFYSDLAVMEPDPQGVCEAAAVPAPGAEEPIDTPLEAEPRLADNPSARKKKVKKVVGLGLKKRGVSSLVAKWQQVQQEVRRDFETLDQDNDSCQ